MRHRVKSKRLNRDEAHLDSMLRNLTTSVILYEKVKTTEPKAKMVKPIIEKLIASTKQDSPSVAIRRLNGYLVDKNATKKMINDILVRYKDRPSGFLRIVPLGFRAGDAASMVQIELV